MIVINNEKSKNAVAVEMSVSSACNLNCRYCYIPKTKELAILNNIIREKLVNGEYLQSMIDSYGADNIENLTFWGAEPTLSLDVFTTKVLDDYITALPNLKNIGFSTNLIKEPDVIVNFLKNIPKTRALNIDIQYSIDGTPEITDRNRGEGSTDKILRHLYELISKVNDLDMSSHNLKFHNKVTWNADNFRYFCEDLSRLNEHIDFIEMIRTTINKTNTSKIPYDTQFWGNAECPGNYTSQDGKNYAQVFNRLKEICKNWPYNTPVAYFHTHGLERIFNFGSEFYNKHSMFTCSAGDSQFAINWDNHISPCHRSVFFTEEQVIKNERNYVQVLKDKHVIKAGDEYEGKRLKYLMGTYHHFTKLLLNNSISIIKELAEVGQILEIYKDYDKAYLLAVYVSIHHCHPEALIEHGTIYAPLISLIRLYGNGVFEIFMTVMGEMYGGTNKK